MLGMTSVPQPCSETCESLRQGVTAYNNFRKLETSKGDDNVNTATIHILTLFVDTRMIFPPAIRVLGVQYKLVSSYIWFKILSTTSLKRQQDTVWVYHHLLRNTEIPQMTYSL
jgi:hypothetical protein